MSTLIWKQEAAEAQALLDEEAEWDFYSDEQNIVHDPTKFAHLVVCRPISCILLESGEEGKSEEQDSEEENEEGEAQDSERDQTIEEQEAEEQPQDELSSTIAPVQTASVSPYPFSRFDFFCKLPPEMQGMVWDVEAKEHYIEPRVVHLHEQSFEIECIFACDKDDPQGLNNFNIKHFSSLTHIPGVFSASIDSRKQCWKLLGGDKTHLGNKFISSIVPFNFAQDKAYFSHETLSAWLDLWRCRTGNHDEYPMKEGAGLTIRKHLQHLVLDAALFLEEDDSAPAGVECDEYNVGLLGAGLSSFENLQTITLVLPRDDEIDDSAIEKPHASVELVTVIPGSVDELMLNCVAKYLHGNIAEYINEWVFINPNKPPSKTKVNRGRKVPEVLVMSTRIVPNQ